MIVVTNVKGWSHVKTKEKISVAYKLNAVRADESSMRTETACPLPRPKTFVRNVQLH